jgi:hypothetical protein
MRDAELVQMVNVSDSKVQWGQKDDLLPREVGKNVEWDYKRAPYKLFADRALLPLTELPRLGWSNIPRHSFCTLPSYQVLGAHSLL